jgi:uncharacterized repeat protein (TIGR03803 family)
VQRIIVNQKSTAAMSLLLLAACSSQATSLPSPTESLRYERIARNATARETVLYSFGGIDGAAPDFRVVRDSSGAFYGTTIFGGTKGDGAVFKLTPAETSYSQAVLYSFRGSPDGQAPDGIVMGRDGALYGVTTVGGNSGCLAGCGIAFKLTHEAFGYKYRVLYRFEPGTDAQQPVGTPVIDKDGNLYGVTQYGGTNNAGAVFELAPGARDAYTESVIYSLPGGAGGYLPQAGLTIAADGALYGTAYYGGPKSECGGGGCGLVFELAPHSHAPKVLHTFAGHDGAQPYAPVTVDDRNRAVYGTTEYGGTDEGTVFKLTRSGSSYRETVLHNFTGGEDGLLPNDQVLLASNGSIYGATEIGGGGCGDVGCGTVFELRRSGGTYRYHLLYAFTNALYGADPQQTTLLAGTGGAIYGTTRSGGTKADCGDGGPGGALGCGVIFELTPQTLFTPAR